MADFICKLGTEIVTRTVEELSELELRQRLAPEGYRIFSIETPGMINGFRGAGARAIKNKHDDFMLYNQAASRPDSSALARLAPTATGPDVPPALAQSEIAADALGRRGAHQVGQRYVLVQRLATLLTPRRHRRNQPFEAELTESKFHDYSFTPKSATRLAIADARRYIYDRIRKAIIDRKTAGPPQDGESALRMVFGGKTTLRARNQIA